MNGTKGLEWLHVRSDLDFIVGARTRFIGVGPGYEQALDHARDLLARPHDQAASDLLTLECDEFAELLVTIVREDGHALTLGATIRELVLEAARRESASSERTEP